MKLCRQFLKLLGAVLLLATQIQVPASAQTPAGKEYKILYVMSYHSPWRWTDWQLEGFQEEMKGVKASYRSFQMDTKRNSSPEQKAAKGKEAQTLIESWKPDLVYTSDDDAQQYLVKHYVNGKLPFVFSGVNADPANYGFRGSANVTGVIEQEHFIESVRLIKKMVPGAKRIALVFDDARMWDPVKARIEKAMAQLPDVQIVANDTLLTFADYKKKISEYQKTADIIGTLGIFNLKDENGKNVTYQEVQKWTVENSRLPDFAFWIDRVHYGTLGAVTVSEREQGRGAGRIARGILVDGKSPASFAMVPTTKGLPVINLARAKQLGINPDAELLLTAEVIQKYEWEQK
ncbi:MAG: ABC transporter substrate binding protein [Pseudomonadota bacterium]